MVGWISWLDKKVFLRLKTEKVFTGKIIDVDERDSKNGIIFLTILDKFDKTVTFVVSEILEIKEED
jgi:hypothetical protein